MHVLKVSHLLQNSTTCRFTFNDLNLFHFFFKSGFEQLGLGHLFQTELMGIVKKFTKINDLLPSY